MGGIIVKQNRFILTVLVMFVLLFVACHKASSSDDSGNNVDIIVGNWQEASYNGVANTSFVYQCSADYALTVLKTGGAYGTGTWSKNGSTYTFSLTGMDATSFTPVFTNSNNTMTYTDGKGFVSVYTRQ